MSVELYDKALLDKINKWTKDTPVTLVNPQDDDTLFKQMADMGNDGSLKLPIISLTRPMGYEILNINRKPMGYAGLLINYSTGKSLKLNAIPIKIEYLIDVYARYKEEAYAITRNLVFNIMNYPSVQVVLPYHGVDYVHNSNIRLNPSINDTTEGIGFAKGQITRLSIGLNIDDAYTWDIRKYTNLVISDAHPELVEKRS